jgi:DNA-binding MarR family transcriptional regulator
MRRARVRTAEEPPGRADALAEIAEVPADRLVAALATLDDRGLVRAADAGYVVTPRGRTLAERLIALRRERLLTYLSDCTEAERTAFAAVLQRLARDLLAQPPQPERPAPRPAEVARAG